MGEVEVTCRCAHHHVGNVRRHRGAVFGLISGAAREMKANSSSGVVYLHKAWCYVFRERKRFEIQRALD